MDSLKRSTAIVIAVVLASYSFLDFAFGCGGSGPCKYTVLRSESVCDGTCILNIQMNK